jgi:hypothetical protein
MSGATQNYAIVFDTTTSTAEKIKEETKDEGKKALKTVKH